MFLKKYRPIINYFVTKIKWKYIKLLNFVLLRHYQVCRGKENNIYNEYKNVEQ